MRKILNQKVLDLPTNLSLSYLWCGGFMLSFFLVVQLMSGVLLSFLYVADSFQAFECVVFISKDLFSGLMRYFHIWGVNFIFFLLLIHMGRSLYYSSYSKLGVWNVGFVLYLLMVVEAFLGYVLPWHQMSYWAATVLTSIMKVFPFVGPSIYELVVGGFSVTKVTLMRMFSLHVCLGFIMGGLSVLHLFYLHKSGSSSPLFGQWGYSDYVSFSPYFLLKDGLAMSIALLLFVVAIWLKPDVTLDVEGFMEGDPLVTPVSMKPEWYFLAYYAMLRSVSSKLGGLVMVLVFLFLLWLPSVKLASCYSLERQIMFWGFCSSFFSLSVLGYCHPEAPFVSMSFFFSLVCMILLALYKTSGVVAERWAISYSLS